MFVEIQISVGETDPKRDKRNQPLHWERTVRAAVRLGGTTNRRGQCSSTAILDPKKNLLTVHGPSRKSQSMREAKFLLTAKEISKISKVKK